MLRWLFRIFFGSVLILVLGAVFAPFLISTEPVPVAELPMDPAASKHAASDDGITDDGGFAEGVTAEQATLDGSAVGEADIRVNPGAPPAGVSSRFVEIDWLGSRPLSFYLLEASPRPLSDASPASSPESLPDASSGAPPVSWGSVDLDADAVTEPEPVSQSAPALVLLHGFTLNANSYLPMIEGLAAFGPVIAYDQLPYGLSDKPQPGSWKGANPYAKTSALEQLFALLDALQIEQAVLVGNSSGGTLALEAARAAPERVRGLILLSPWVYAERPQLPIWLAESPQMWRISLLLARYLGGEMPLLDLSYADPSRIDAVRRAQAQIHQRMPGWDLAWATLLQRSLWDPVTIAEELPKIEQPTLVVTGSADAVVPPQDSARVAEALPNASFISLEGCGHLPQEECPEALLPVIEGWLADQPGLSLSAP